jgi:uncharacterized membrane protein
MRGITRTVASRRAEETGQQPHSSFQLKTWFVTNWCDLLLSAALVASGVVGYVALYTWLIQLASFSVH